MSVDVIDFDVGDKTYEGVVNTQRETTDEGVLILPGAGHGPYGDIFDIIAYELAGIGKQVLRYESWTAPDELREKTLAELHEEVDAAVEYLRAEGCSTIQVLAKSFGGGIALTHVPDAVDSLVLWAPAIELDEPAVVNEPHETIGESETLVIGIQNLDHIEVPVRILRGTEDEGVTRNDCERIVGSIVDGRLTEIPGEDHSFNQNRTAIVEHTLEYAAADSSPRKN